MKVIITGSTGMVGQGVLLECIDEPRIKGILLLNRSPLNIEHPKVKEVLHSNFKDLSSIKNELVGYDACFHCMGVSSAGMSEEKYTDITYNITKELAETLHRINPEIVLNYVSGTGTDSKEESSTMWARVKGKTENMIFEMGFKDSYMFRPGVILPERGIKSKTTLYNAAYIILKPFYSIIEKIKSVTTTTNMGKAMINSLFYPQKLKHLEGEDINILSSVNSN